VSQQSKEVLPVLLAALKDTSQPPPPKGGIGRLDENMLLRREAVQVLADMGPVAREAVPALRTAIGDRSPEVRVEAARALWKVDGQVDPAVKVLVEVLEMKDPSVGPFPLSGAQVQAAEYLGEMGPAARLALPVLQRVRADRSQSSDIRNAAARAVEKIDVR
jgi:HEAT repeat protein